MLMARKLGHAEFGSRDLYTLSLRHFKIPPGAFKEISGHFIACLAMDGTAATDEEIKTIALDLIQAGCVYICCWGEDCERVHNLIDQEDLILHPDRPWNMTTWHNDVPLHEALWFSINSAWPDSAFAETTHAVVGMAFHNPDWSDQVSEVFSDPIGFSQNVLRPS
jgi:hypothetical protein